MDFYSLVTVLLVILITVVLAKYTKILLDRSELPPGPTPLPIIGTLHLMNLNDIVKSLLDLSKKYGDIFTVYEWSQPVIVLCGHKAIKETLIDKAEEFSGRAYYPVFFDVTKGDVEDLSCINEFSFQVLRWAGKGGYSPRKESPRTVSTFSSPPEHRKAELIYAGKVINCRAEKFVTNRIYYIAFSNGEQWKELRRFAMLTLGNFGVGKSSFEERIREEAQYLTDVLKKSNGSPIDPNYHMERCVSNVTCSVMFGSRFEYKDEHFQKLVKCVRDNFRIMSSCWGLLYNICPSVMKHLPGPHRKILENFVFLATFIKNKMENNMKTLDSNNPRDYIDCFLIKMEKEKKNTSTFYNPNTLVMSSVGLFFAGTETVTLTLRFMLLYFIKHPSIAEKVYREIDEVIGQRPPTYEDRHYMPYTAAFINEVLRYADVIPLSLPHKLTADTQIRNYRFKKGTAFTPLLSSVHNDKSLFNNPENFDPNNFLNENGELKKTESWFPFSAGKRLCLGKSLAVVELFIFTTTLLQNFTIKSSVPPEKISVTPVGVGLGHIPPSFEACFLPRTCS